MINIKLLMPKTESDGDNGINDGNIETYKNSPMESLTKEEEQNSTDSALLTSKEPVVIEYNEFYLSPSEIPDIDKLISVYHANRTYWDRQLVNDRKAIKFFDNALDILTSEKIRCLRISDFNTTGVTGILSSSGPWRNLVKNTGVSDKLGKSGGSFGIGKHAAFACSDLRLVFYNTVNNENKTAFQGVLKLPSYKCEVDNFTGTGYYSNPNSKHFEPLYENISLDPAYKRPDDATGLDKFIIGFDQKISSLKDEIIISSLNNFLLAFYENSLIVKYNDIVISSDTLDVLMDSYDSDPRLKTVTKEYYSTLKSADDVISITVFDKDDVKIFIKLDSSFSRRAAIVRQTGMKVFDKSRLSGSIGFAAVIKLVGDKVNQYFKKLENAEHNQWSEYRAEDKGEIIKNQDKIFSPLKKAINDLHQVNFSEKIDADGMNEYLPYSYLRGSNSQKDALTNIVNEPISIRKRETKNDSVINETIDLQKDPEGEIGASIGEGKSEGDNPYIIPGNDITFSEVTSSDTHTIKKVQKDKFKLRLTKTSTGYQLMFQSQKNMNSAILVVKISGETLTAPVNIKKAYIGTHNLKVSKNMIYLTGVKSKSTHKIDFELTKDHNWALEVDIYEDKK